MDEQEALRAEYAARENDRIVAVRTGGPALLAWDKLRKRQDIAQPRMDAMLRSLSRHRAHITELTVSLREKAAANTKHDDASQLEIFAETWQLVAATETLLSMQKRARVAGAAYQRLGEKTRKAQEAARNNHQTPIRDAHNAFAETRARMERLGMEIPVDKFADWMQEQETLKRRQAAESSSGAETARKPRKQAAAAASGGALAMTELLDELSTIEAAVPGTDKLWRALEGTTAGRTKRTPKPSKKPRRKYDIDGSYLDEPPEHMAWWAPPNPVTSLCWDLPARAPLGTIFETDAET